MKTWKIIIKLDSGQSIIDVCKARNIQQAMIETGSNFNLPAFNRDEAISVTITQLRNLKQLEEL